MPMQYTPLTHVENINASNYRNSMSLVSQTTFSDRPSPQMTSLTSPPAPVSLPTGGMRYNQTGGHLPNDDMNRRQGVLNRSQPSVYRPGAPNDGHHSGYGAVIAGTGAPYMGSSTHQPGVHQSSGLAANHQASGPFSHQASGHNAPPPVQILVSSRGYVYVFDCHVLNYSTE